MHVVSHMVRKDSSAIKFNRVEIAFISALLYWLRPLFGKGGGGGGGCKPGYPEKTPDDELDITYILCLGLLYCVRYFSGVLFLRLIQLFAFFFSWGIFVSVSKIAHVDRQDLKPPVSINQQDVETASFN